MSHCSKRARSTSAWCSARTESGTFQSQGWAANPAQGDKHHLFEPGMFVVRADSRYRTIKDLIGRPVVWNSRGSGPALQGRFVMEGLGLDPEKDFEAIYIATLAEGPMMILEGRAAALWGAGDRWPGFVKIANDARGARCLTPGDGDVTRR